MDNSIISPIFYNRTNIDGNKYKVLSEFKKDIYIVKFKDSKVTHKFSYDAIINNNLEVKVNKPSKSKKIPSNQIVDFEKCDKFIDIKIVYDTREQNLTFLDYLELDTKRKSDNTQVTMMERKCVTPVGCSVSTGDLTYEYRYNSGKNDWIRTNFVVEIKKNMDLFSSIFTAENYNRLLAELDRAVNAKLDFYFICDTDLTRLVNNIKKLESSYINGKFKKKQLPINSHIIFLEKFINFNQELSSRGFPEIICAGDDMFLIIKRLIKRNLKDTLKNAKV